MIHLACLALQVVCDEAVSGGLFAVVGHHDTAAADHLSRLAFLINSAQTNPLAQLLIVVDLDQVDVVLVTERFDQFRVHRLTAVGG